SQYEKGEAQPEACHNEQNACDSRVPTPGKLLIRSRCRAWPLACYSFHGHVSLLLTRRMRQCQIDTQVVLRPESRPGRAIQEVPGAAPRRRAESKSRAV